LPGEVPEEITFAAGLVGCGDWQRFRLVQTEDAAPISLLQCVDEPEIGFYVVDPYLIAEEYELEMPPAAAQAIGLRDWKEALVFCTLVVRQEPQSVTANLLGPLVVNRANGLGVQVVLSGSGYSSRHLVPCGSSEAGQC